MDREGIAESVASNEFNEKADVEETADNCARKARDSADRTNHVACGSPRVMFATILLQYRTLQKFRISGDEFEELSLRRKN